MTEPDPHKSKTRPTDSLTQDCYEALTESVRTVNVFPSGPARDLFSTYTSFNAVIDHLSESVLAVANAVLAAQDVRLRFKKGSESSWQVLEEANDYILDRTSKRDEVDTRVCGRTVEPAAYRNSNYIDRHRPQATAPNAAQSEKAQNVFKIKVDNSPDTLWSPLITEKPNSTFPLKIEPMLDENATVIGFYNPYEEEIETFKLQPQWFEPKTPIAMKSLSETPYTYVDTEEELLKLSAHLTTVGEIAIDVEHHSLRTYQGLTCLLQVSTESGGDYIIDTLKLRGKLQSLNLAFTNPKIKKILHGATNDIIWLQRDCGLYVVGLFDTYVAAMILKYDAKKLMDLVSKFCGVKLDKKFQTADWTVRPLPAEQLLYARLDTHYLIYIAQCITAELVKCSDNQRSLIELVYDKSRTLCKQAYIKPTVNDKSYLTLVSYPQSMSKNQLKALKLLYDWRDRCARVEDESVSYILPDGAILKLSKELPRDIKGITRACGGRMSEIVKRDLSLINQIMLECQQSKCDGEQIVAKTEIPKTHTAAPEQIPHEAERYFARLPLGGCEDSDNYATSEPSYRDLSSPLPTATTTELSADAAAFLPPFVRYEEYIEVYEEQKPRNQNKLNNI